MRIPLLTAATLCVLSSAAAADSKPIAGSWAGEIDIPGQTLAITITFDGGSAGLIDIPQQHASGIPLGKVAVDGTHVTFTITAAAATFDGTLDHDAIAGTMSQNGGTFPFKLARSAQIQRETYAAPPPPRVPLSMHVGHALLGRWEGTARDDAGAAPIAMEFDAHGGVVTGTAGVTNGCQPLDAVSNLSLTFDRVQFEVARPNLPPSYADLRLAGDTLSGTGFRGHPLKLELHRVAPAAPPPYSEVELAIPSTGGTQLAGTLTLPAPGTGPARPAVVVLVTGSGPQDRDECVVGVRPFKQLADRLARAGIATLRYDDRGTAKSTGDFKTATAADFADDAEAAVKLLAARADVDPKRIGILGHSEGGLIAPMVAARDPQVAFIVLWAGPGLPLDRVIVQQTHDIGLAEGGKPEDIERQVRISEVVWKAFHAAKDEAGFAKNITAGLAKLSKDDRAAIKDPEAFTKQQVTELWSPWFRWYSAYDPAKTLAKVKVPVLAVNGSMDKQVDAKANLAAIKKADPKAEVVELPGLNHLFQPTKTGAVSEYEKNPPVLDPAVLDLTASWIAKH